MCRDDNMLPKHSTTRLTADQLQPQSTPTIHQHQHEMTSPSPIAQAPTRHNESPREGHNTPETPLGEPLVGTPRRSLVVEKTPVLQQGASAPVPQIPATPKSVNRKANQQRVAVEKTLDVPPKAATPARRQSKRTRRQSQRLIADDNFG